MEEGEVIFSFFKRSKVTQADRDREAFLATLTSIVSSFAATQQSRDEAMTALAEANQAQAKVLQEHLALFQVSSPPESRTMRDSDEYLHELKRTGFPVGAPEKDQMNWVLKQSGIEDD